MDAIVATLLLFAGTSLFWSMTHGESLVDVISFALVAVALMVAARPATSRHRAIVGWSLAALIPILLGFVVPRANTSGALAAVRPAAALFSSSIGLLSLTPIVYLALIGTVAYGRRNGLWTVASVIVLVLWLIVPMAGGPAGTATEPFAHGLTPLLAVVSPGLALLIQAARAFPWVAVAPLVLASILWNYWMMVQYTVGLLPKDAPISFSSLVRQQAEVQTRPPYVFPFAWPANLWFAWRNELPADRFELLAFEPRRGSWDLVLDRAADRFVLDGWEPPAADAGSPIRWTRDDRATLALPLQVASGRFVDIVVTARARLEEPAVSATLALELNGHEIGRFVAPPTAPTDATLRVSADVGHLWRAGYNRLTLVSNGVQRMDPSDARPPGPLARRLGGRAWPVAISRVRVVPAP